MTYCVLLFVSHPPCFAYLSVLVVSFPQKQKVTNRIIMNTLNLAAPIRRVSWHLEGVVQLLNR